MQQQSTRPLAVWEGYLSGMVLVATPMFFVSVFGPSFIPVWPVIDDGPLSARALGTLLALGCSLTGTLIVGGLLAAFHLGFMSLETNADRVVSYMRSLGESLIYRWHRMLAVLLMSISACVIFAYGEEFALPMGLLLLLSTAYFQASHLVRDLTPHTEEAASESAVESA